MGRAIDMENQLESHDIKIKKLEKLISELEKTINVILDAVPSKKTKQNEDKKDAEEKDNNETNGTSGKQFNTGRKSSKK